MATPSPQIMAECGDAKGLPTVQERQVQFLAESLAAMRVAEKADVVMVCGEKEFYAHKLILEANSLYFMAMFQSNLQEAKSGKIVFQDMDPETLDAILDFLYLGDVKKMTTGDELMKVLKASHMMELQNLFQYCCTSLPQMLSSKNFLTIWILAEKYEANGLLAEVKCYFLKNYAQILTSNDLLVATVNQLKDLLVFSKSKLNNIDGLLKTITLWVLHDLPVREQFTGEIFAHIDANRVSMQCAKSLLDNGKLMAVSRELADRLKDLVIEVCFAKENEFSEKAEDSETPHTVTTDPKTCGLKLFFLMQQNVTKVVGKSETPKESFESFAAFQLFDLGTMTWQPKKQLPCLNFKVDAICQYNDCIFLTGSSAGNLHVLYDVDKNTLEYVNTSNNLSLPNASACYFKNCLYLVGGSAANADMSHQVVCLKDGANTWYKTSPLKHSRENPIIFTSENFLYVLGDSSSSLSMQSIEITNGINHLYYNNYENIYLMSWSVVVLPMDFISKEVKYFPYNNQLCGVCNVNDAFLKVVHDGCKWKVQTFPQNLLQTELKVKSISHLSTQKNPFVLISTPANHHGIPSYILEPGSFEWTKLPEPKGECDVKDCWNLLNTSCYFPPMC